MDGASKFVRGDAIAAVIIVAINTIGGFIVGIAQMHMDFMTALSHFTLLTVGEGIVTQVPALLISTATGIIVTRAAAESDFGNDITRQLTAQPKALLIAAIMTAIFGIAGLARPLFLGLSALLFFMYWQSPPQSDFGDRHDAADARRRLPPPLRAERPLLRSPQRASCRCFRTIRWSWRSASASSRSST